MTMKIYVVDCLLIRLNSSFTKQFTGDVVVAAGLQLLLEHESTKRCHMLASRKYIKKSVDVTGLHLRDFERTMLSAFWALDSRDKGRSNRK